MRRWKWLLLAPLAAGAAFAAWLFFVWPPPSWYNSHWPAETAFMAMRESQYAAARDTVSRRYQPVPLATMSRWLGNAATVAEDDAFFDHHGVDWRAIRQIVGYRREDFSWRDGADRAELARALRQARASGSQMRGGSTITQQLAKNLYLSPSRNPLRKLKEAVIAYRLEWALSKERILALYLNVAEFGPNVWGVEAASRRYFRKGAGQLTLDQAALLVATLPHPLSSNPGHRPGRTRFRAQLIARRLRGEPVEVPQENEEPASLPAPPLPQPPETLPVDSPPLPPPPDSVPADTVTRDSPPAQSTSRSGMTRAM